jgi:hypothetical protein
MDTNIIGALIGAAATIGAALIAIAYARPRTQPGTRSTKESDSPAPSRTPRLMSPHYGTGRLLQLVGLFLLPFGIASELMKEVSLGQSMLIAAIGAGIFYTGYVIQHRGS